VRHQSRRVRIVEGAGEHLSDQTRLLLRARLRLAALLVMIGSGAFLIWVALLGNLPFSGREALVSWVHLATIVAAGWAAYELWQPRLMSWRGLRITESVIFGAPALLVLVVQFEQMLRDEPMTRLPISTAAWSGMAFTYAMFIPNPWRRAARIMGGVVLTPVLLAIVAKGWIPQPPDDFWEQWSGMTLLLVLVVGVATYGTHVIGALRRQAFEARQLGQYRLTELLGSGGMGDVWLAEHQLLKRPCAIKLIEPSKSADPRAQARFEREVRATARLSHWNSVEIFDYGRTDDGTFYYVMEYLPGLTLAELVERHGPLSPARVICLLRQACAGLREAHAQGLIHRDIKPGNIIAAYRGGIYDVVKVLDFGLVELLGDRAATWKRGSAIAGSPLFMAPEQALEDSGPDARSDIYSLGAVGYFLLTGRPPFEGATPLAIVIAHAHDPVTPPSRLQPEIPEDVENVLLRCLAKEPNDRFQTVDQLERALAACALAESWTNEKAAEWWKTHEPELVANLHLS
jgi:serine/threonine-protein kinase